jgi:ankyrin repeat protein
VNYLELKRVPRTVASSRYGTPICRYPIEFAAATSSLEIVKLLVERGATLEKTNALHAAAGGIGRGSPQERVKVMEFLLEKGFDINALEFAQEPEFPEQYESRIYGTPLHYAAAWGLDDRLEFLLQKGADPNILGYNYKTKEHWGTALDWQKLNEEDEGCYSERIRELLDDKAKE